MTNLKSYLCRFCGETDSFLFYIKGKMKSCCLKCHTIYVHQKQRELKIKAIEYLGGECIRCGYKGVAAVYDFHHRDSAIKDFSWGDKRTSNWEKLKVELDKCDLLCSNCHREVHDNDWFNKLPNHHPEKLRRL
jgi:hypothetical protein